MKIRAERSVLIFFKEFNEGWEAASTDSATLLFKYY